MRALSSIEHQTFRDIAPAWDVVEGYSYNDPMRDELRIRVTLESKLNRVQICAARHPSEVMNRLSVDAMPNRMVRTVPYRPARKRVRFR